MSNYVTHKNTREHRAQTLARKLHRRAKYGVQR